MKNKMDLFTAVDEQVEKYVVKNFDDIYTLGKAQLFGIDIYKTVEPIVQKIGDDADVYEMLSPMHAILGADYDAFGLVTTGWAAPTVQSTTIVLHPLNILKGFGFACSPFVIPMVVLHLRYDLPTRREKSHTTKIRLVVP
jgi:hypothetical protein